MLRKFGSNMGVGRGAHLWEDHTYQGDVHVPSGRGWPMWDCNGDVEKGVITVDGEPAYPAAPHPKCVAAGTCQGPCLWEDH